jgi:hypothetical protein
MSGWHQHHRCTDPPAQPAPSTLVSSMTPSQLEPMVMCQDALINVKHTIGQNIQAGSNSTCDLHAAVATAIAHGDVNRWPRITFLPVTPRDLSCMSGWHRHHRCTGPPAQAVPSALQSSPRQHHDPQSTESHCLTLQRALDTRLEISAHAAQRWQQDTAA